MYVKIPRSMLERYKACGSALSLFDEIAEAGADPNMLELEWTLVPHE